MHRGKYGKYIKISYVSICDCCGLADEIKDCVRDLFYDLLALELLALL